MNKKILAWWDSHRVGGKAYAKLVLMFLALDASKDGHGATSRRRLSRDANLPEGDIIGHLIDLEKLGLIKADINERGEVIYELNLKKKGERAR